MNISPFDLPQEIRSKYINTRIFKAVKAGSTIIKIYPYDPKKTGAVDLWRKHGQTWHRMGIETVGIGLGVDVSHLFPVALAINDLQELRTQLFELSKSLLLVA